jgi:hypothetical protein
LAVIDLVSWAVLGLVSLLLVWTLTRQFTVLGRRGQMLDALGIVPQWKFFAQRRIDGNPAAFVDLHVLVRTATGVGAPGPWQVLLHWHDRPLRHALWNPRRAGRSLIGECATQLAEATAGPASAMPPTALSYLTVLRFCLDRTALDHAAVLQFVVVATLGRGNRDPQLRFVSAWHSS